MTDLKKGDLVSLKSGGPSMTIKNIGKYDYHSYDSALCAYFNEKNELVEKVFEFKTLVKLEED